MKTLYLSPDETSKAAEIIKNGGIVAFPTETVYGLGANALDENAVRKVYEAKGRPSDNPLIIHIPSEAELEALVPEVPPAAKILMEKFWPGPLTIILKKGPSLPPAVTGGRGTAAIRCPAHPVAGSLLREAGVPIAAPSANISGRPSPTSAAHVLADLDGRIDAVLDGGACPVGIESAIINIAGEIPRLLRPGTITRGMIEEALGHEIEVSAATLSEAEAPGMKYTHYAPKAELTVVCGSTEEVISYINNACIDSGLVKDKIGVFAAFENISRYGHGRVISAGPRNRPEEAARKVFAALRQFDDWGVRAIYSEAFYGTEVGDSVMNRLEKAAGGRVHFVKEDRT